MDNKEILERINEKRVSISTCVQSLQFILKDIEEMEMKANSESDNSFLGLSNIVEQLAERIKKDNADIMVLSE